MPFSSTALLLALLLLSGCATYRSTTQVQDGPGLEYAAAEVESFRNNQDAVLKQLYGMASEGATDARAAGGWDRVIEAGMDFADSKCERYMHALFRLNRDKRTVGAQIGLLGTATAGLMAAADSAAKEVAAVAVLFGLATATVDNLASNLLYDLDPSSVRTLVKSLQSSYRTNLQVGYTSRPAAIRVIRAYAMLCVPANIEAEVNLAVKRAQPLAHEGNPEKGQPPEVSNAESIVSPLKAKLDDQSALLKDFVFPGGQLNLANRKALEVFLRKKNIDVDVTSFMTQGRFAAERAEAVKELKLK
jgi:hypothetical protein